MYGVAITSQFVWEQIIANINTGVIIGVIFAFAIVVLRKPK